MVLLRMAGYDVSPIVKPRSLGPTHVDRHVVVRACAATVSTAPCRRVTGTLSRRTHKMMGPSVGTFSEPNTSMERKNEVMAEWARRTSGL
jgi:hypothetical protein